MANLAKFKIYIAIRTPQDRTHIEDELVLDGIDVSSFTSANDLWEYFRIHPCRFVITDRHFLDYSDGMELARTIRQNHPTPYVYVLVRSIMSEMNDITQGLELGVDDYLVRPHNPFEIRARVLVGMRWLRYIDSIMGSPAPEIPELRVL
jgi:DNA-binding response OmpR family regulator